IRAIVHTILHLRIRPTPFPYTTLFRSKDLYFPPEDEAWSVQHIPDAELRVIPGIWGHLAGGGADPDAAASGSAPPPARCPQMPGMTRSSASGMCWTLHASSSGGKYRSLDRKSVVYGKGVGLMRRCRMVWTIARM